jgi:hypothetical protein
MLSMTDLKDFFEINHSLYLGHGGLSPSQMRDLESVLRLFAAGQGGSEAMGPGASARPSA